MGYLTNEGTTIYHTIYTHASGPTEEEAEEEWGETMPLGHEKTAALINSQLLWLPALDLHKGVNSLTQEDLGS